MRKMQICDYFIVIAFILSLSAMGADQSGSTTLSSLPAAAQARISAALGKDNPGYSMKAVTSGFETINAGQKLVARFTSEGVEVRNGTARWGLALRGYGYGNALTTAKTAAPQATANRVEYRRGELTEWYVNGPVGLEQGFTLNQPPEKATGQPLTVALAVSGNLRMKLDESGTGISLSEREGNAELRYIGLTATDAKGTDLKAWLEVQEERLLLKVDDVTARYPVMIDPWVQLAKLTASDGTTGDYLGWSVARSGNTVVVGAPRVPNSCGWGSGTAYVFIKPVSGWADMTQTAKLTPSGCRGVLNFGYSVAISGKTVVVGAPTDFHMSGLPARVYVFIKPWVGWKDMTETAELSASDGQEDFSHLGASVAIDGDTVVVGAPWIDNSVGAVYVFLKPVGGWISMTETAKLTPSDSGNGTFNLGSSVAISGSTVVASKFEIDNWWNWGAYVFVKPEGGWTNMTETAKLITSDGFGLTAIAVSGDTVVAGAPFGKKYGRVTKGGVYVC